MFLCTLCHFETELDDVVVKRLDGSCVCLRCHLRTVADDAYPLKVMDKHYRRQIQDVLNTITA